MPNHSFSRRSFLKTLSAASFSAPFVTSGLMAQSPNGVVRHASFGSAGQAGADIRELTKFSECKLVAVADVDQRRSAELQKHFPDVKVYQDWRKLLEAEAKNIDSVNVSTPDHMHAPIAMSAMELGKHVYCQKPLAHDLYEARKMKDYAHNRPIVTQMGIQIHSYGVYRMAVKLVRDGVIGKVKEVHLWNPKPWGDTAGKPEGADPVPEGLDWQGWLGVCADRPFLGKGYYHPQTWRKRIDFGTGTLGDMGCHIFDPVFSALGLTAPLTVRSEGPAPNDWNWQMKTEMHYLFPGTPYTAEKTVKAVWYDGGEPLPKDILDLLEGDELPNSGSIMVGTEGTLVVPHIARPQLYPDKKFKDYVYPQVVGGDHYGEFVEACRGLCLTSAGFDYSGPLAEAVLVGTVACRFPKTTLRWHAKKLEFDLPAANRFVKRDYRAGWEVKGLS